MTTNTHYSIPTTFRLPKTLLHTIDHWCEENDCTQSQFFRKAIVDHIKEVKQKRDEKINGIPQRPYAQRS